MGRGMATPGADRPLKSAGNDERRGRLRLEGLHKTYDSVRSVLDGVDLAAPAGTLIPCSARQAAASRPRMRVVAGLGSAEQRPHPVSGRDVAAMARPCPPDGAGVSELRPCFPHLSVARNIAFGWICAAQHGGIARQVEDTLGMVQLAGLGGRMPRQLSGGQPGSALHWPARWSSSPDLLLLDKPLPNRRRQAARGNAQRDAASPATLRHHHRVQ